MWINVGVCVPASQPIPLKRGLMLQIAGGMRERYNRFAKLFLLRRLRRQ